MRKLLAGLLVLAASGGVALANPTPEQIAQAKKLYTTAEAEVRISKFAEAAKDYTSAYELTQDPALLFKIASAHQNAGACDSAVAYYRRYLREASPSPKFAALTKERITKCGAPVDEPAPTPAPPPTPEVAPAPPPAPEAKPEPSPPEVNPSPAPPTSVANPPAAADAKVEVKADDEPTPGHARDSAWAMAGGAVFLGGAGAVLYAQANSSGTSSYKDISYVAFGLGAVAAAASVYCFVRHDPHAADHASLIVPTAQPHGAGLAAMFRF